ncbi:MAG: hypothetical protein IJ233_01785 [Pyramidobacter sp.]|nr:hypothetical protein [Pyramidobacter sp.]
MYRMQAVFSDLTHFLSFPVRSNLDSISASIIFNTKTPFGKELYDRSLPNGVLLLFYVELKALLKTSL